MPVISLLAHSDSIIEIATITTNIINISQLSNDCIHRCLPPHHWLGGWVPSSDLGEPRWAGLLLTSDSAPVAGWHRQIWLPFE